MVTTCLIILTFVITWVITPTRVITMTRDHMGVHIGLCDQTDLCDHTDLCDCMDLCDHTTFVGPDQNNVEFPGETVNLFLLQGLTAAVDNYSVPSIATQTNTTVRSTTKQLAEKSWVKSILRLSLRKSRNFNSTLCRSDSSQAGTLDWF